MSDQEMILNSATWPRFPRLPLRRGNEVGVLTVGTGLTVRLGNVFDEDASTGTLLAYENVTELLADGWEVD